MGVAGICVLGPLAVDGGAGHLGPRDRVVLAVLALYSGEVVSAERLADALWGDQPPPSWNKVVPGCVMRLRRALGAETIETTPHGYRLMVRADDIDARRFERQVARGRELLTLGEPERAAHVVGEALSLWRGRALVELEGWEAGRIEALRLEELRLDAEELRLEAALRAGRFREVLGEARARVGEAPLRERRWALLALAQYQAGRQGEALRTLHQARTALATELGVDPGPDLISLEQAILRQDASLVATDTNPAPSPVCPYLGLVAYDIGDAETFFGRDAEVAACLQRLATAGVLAVVGPSGSGKSSLVRAGVAAALRRERHRVVVITPGAHPVDALTAMAGSGPDAVLVVDQCEEALTVCADPGERNRFFTALADHAERAPLIVAVRADRMGDASGHPGFARLLERGLHLLTAMSETDLRAAVEGPAHQAGLLLEPGLVDLLVRELDGEPGALPLLSHALRQTWERREERTLTVAGYRSTGGVRGAVAQSAEAIYERIPPEQRSLLRDVLLRLVSTTGDGEPVPNPVPRRTLATDAEHEDLIELLVGARLLTSDDGVIQLAHEALARAWPRLRGWLDDDIAGQRLFRHLADAADAWSLMGRPDTELYRGIRLTQALEWRDRSGANLTPTEREFLDASQRLAEAEVRQARESVRRRRRSRRWVRATLAGVAVLVVAVIVAGVLAVRQDQRADTATAAVDAQQIGSEALTTDDIDRSMLLAVEAVRLDDTRQTRANLLTVLARSPELVASAHHDTPIESLAVNPRDGAVIVGAPTGGVSLHAADTLDEAGSEPDAPWRLEFRPDGRQIAAAATTAGEDDAATSGEDRASPLQLLDPSTFDAQSAQPGGLPSDAEIMDLGYSADGRFLAASTATTVLVWDVETPARPALRLDQDERPWAIVLSPDGAHVYVASGDPAGVGSYDVATGRVLNTLELVSSQNVGSAEAGDRLDISADGASLVIGDGNQIAIVDTATLTERARLRGHTGQVLTVGFSHDGGLLASGSVDDSVAVWDVATGAQRDHLRGHTGAVGAIAFSPDDATLYTGSVDRRVLAWDIDGERRLLPRTALVDLRPTSATLAVPAPDGEAVVYIGTVGPGSEADDTVQFLDIGSGRLGGPIVTGRRNYTPTWQPPDYDLLATAGRDGYVRMWDRSDGTLAVERQVSDGPITALAFTPDGSRLLVADQTNGLLQVDAASLESVGPTMPFDHRIHELTVGPDGRTAVALSDGDLLTIIDLVAGSVHHRVNLGFGARTADISPDGNVAVVCFNGEVALIDIETGRWVSEPKFGNDAITRVAFAEDGDTFAASGATGLVGLWDGATGSDLGASVRPGEPTWSAVEFLPDGHTVVIADRNGAVYAWSTRPEDWIDHACAVAGRNLTDDEWRTTFGSRRYHETCPTG